MIFKRFKMALWTIITTIIYTILIGIPIIIVAFLSKNFRVSYRMGVAWAWLIMKTNRVKVTVLGSKKIAQQKSYIYISNHLSNLDPIAVARSMPNPLRFIGKHSLTRIPIFGSAAKMAKMIFIDRSNSLKAVETINRAVRDLKGGISAFFFAEGTRSTDGTVRPFKKGGVILALKARLPIVPVTIINSDRLLGKNSVRIKKGVLKIIVGDPIDTSKFTLDDRDKVLALVEDVIRKTFIQYREALNN